MIDPAAIEVSARAIYLTWSMKPDAAQRWDAGKVMPDVKTRFRQEAANSLAALEAAGFVIVNKRNGRGQH
jgi:hypothetical protein